MGKCCLPAGTFFRIQGNRKKLTLSFFYCTFNYNIKLSKFLKNLFIYFQYFCWSQNAFWLTCFYLDYFWWPSNILCHEAYPLVKEQHLKLHKHGQTQFRKHSLLWHLRLLTTSHHRSPFLLSSLFAHTKFRWQFWLWHGQHLMSILLSIVKLSILFIHQWIVKKLWCPLTYGLALSFSLLLSSKGTDP